MWNVCAPPSQVDMEAFATMSSEDLLDIGIEDAEHRLKLLNLILKLNRQQVRGVVSLLCPWLPHPLTTPTSLVFRLQRLLMIAWCTRSQLPPGLTVRLLHLRNASSSMLVTCMSHDQCITCMSHDQCITCTSHDQCITCMSHDQCITCLS